MSVLDTATAVWANPTRTVAAGSAGTPATPAERVAARIWSHGTRTLTSASPPGAISNLTAVASSPTQVDLTWTPATGATSHRIVRIT